MLLSMFVKGNFPNVTKVVLAVNKKNQAAYQLYKKAGFKDEGKTKMGKIGEQHILELPIKS